MGETQTKNNHQIKRGRFQNPLRVPSFNMQDFQFSQFTLRVFLYVKESFPAKYFGTVSLKRQQTYMVSEDPSAILTGIKCKYMT